MNTIANKVSALLLLVLVPGLVLSADTFVATPQGALYKDLEKGSGKTVEVGDVVTLHFVGWLDANGEKGKEIFNTRRQHRTVSFVVGTDKVMPGWNEGVIGMKKGGKRLLKLTPALGYGARGAQGVVPADARLIFMFELVDLRE